MINYSMWICFIIETCGLISVLDLDIWVMEMHYSKHLYRTMMLVKLFIRLFQKAKAIWNHQITRSLQDNNTLCLLNRSSFRFISYSTFFNDTKNRSFHKINEKYHEHDTFLKIRRNQIFLSRPRVRTRRWSKHEKEGKKLSTISHDIGKRFINDLELADMCKDSVKS